LGRFLKYRGTARTQSPVVHVVTQSIGLDTAIGMLELRGDAIAAVVETHRFGRAFDADADCGNKIDKHAFVRILRENQHEWTRACAVGGARDVGLPCAAVQLRVMGAPPPGGVPPGGAPTGGDPPDGGALPGGRCDEGGGRFAGGC